MRSSQVALTAEEFEQLELHIEEVVETKITAKLNKLILAVVLAGVGSVSASVGTLAWAGYEWGTLKNSTLLHDVKGDQHIGTFVTRSEWTLVQAATVDQLTDIKESLRDISARLNKTASLDKPALPVP